MRKIVVILILICGNLSGASAQKSKLSEVRKYLTENNYKAAIPVINEAVANEETKNDAEAWFLRGFAYLQNALDEKAHAPEAAGESYSSLMKALAIKPDYGDEINSGLYANAVISFNEGVAAYGTKDYNTAYDRFMKVGSIYKAGGAKRFGTDKNVKDFVANSKTNAAYAAMNGKKYSEALALFTELKNTTGRLDSSIYKSIIDIYREQNASEASLLIINEARRLFPNSPTFRNIELNYYITAGKQDVLLGKLEEALKTDPNNPELLFNLGNAYERAAFPKDAKGAAMDRPANYSEMFSKSEATYKNAIAAKPSSADYNYNLGVLYYEAAAAITKEMNTIKGTTAEDNKKYDALVLERNALFVQALPYFEKAQAILSSRGTLSNEDQVTQQNASVGIKEINSRLNGKTKAGE
jgi:hypothetical protein